MEDYDYDEEDQQQEEEFDNNPIPPPPPPIPRALPLPPLPPPPPPANPNNNPAPALGNLAERIAQQQQALNHVDPQEIAAAPIVPSISNNVELSQKLFKQGSKVASKHTEKIAEISGIINGRRYDSFEHARKVLKDALDLETELSSVDTTIIQRSGWPGIVIMEDLRRGIEEIVSLTNSFSVAQGELALSKSKDNFEGLERSVNEIRAKHRNVLGVMGCIESRGIPLPFDIAERVQSQCIDLLLKMMDQAFKKYDRVAVCTSKFDVQYAVKKAFTCLNTCIQLSKGLDAELGEKAAEFREKIVKTAGLLNKLLQENQELLKGYHVSANTTKSVVGQFLPKEGHHNEIGSDPSQYSKFLSKPKTVEAKLNEHITFYAREGDISKVKQLIKEKVPIDEPDKSGYTALYYSVMRGKLDVAEVLLEAGANANFKYKGNSCLHVAAEGSNPALVSLLIKHGADFNIANLKGENVVHLACRAVQWNVVKALVELCGDHLLMAGDSYKRLPLQILAIKGIRSTSNNIAPTIRQPAPIILGLDLSSYLLSKQFSDVTFRVESETFYGHKIILCSQSPPFRTMLDGSGPWRETANNEIPLHDINALSFKHFLQWLYTGEAGVAAADVNIWIDLLSLSDRFLVPSLKARCEYALSLLVSIGNAIPLYHHSVLYQAPLLTQVIEDFILYNYSELLQDDNENKTLYSILDSRASKRQD
eukprot:TRINITY_DN4052_c0_g1_i1.p1 TRINITY_DN4052_c0_g1~~TRINITY_DN4052_c0_g1_i1.p1  ORF type:complete len:706 (-),score=152.28 TRINITY_DN4052_c0_g1_i1:75-2192(-)